MLYFKDKEDLVEKIKNINIPRLFPKINAHSLKESVAKHGYSLGFIHVNYYSMDHVYVVEWAVIDIEEYEIRQLLEELENKDEAKTERLEIRKEKYLSQPKHPYSIPIFVRDRYSKGEGLKKVMVKDLESNTLDVNENFFFVRWYPRNEERKDMPSISMARIDAFSSGYGITIAWGQREIQVHLMILCMERWTIL